MTVEKKGFLTSKVILHYQSSNINPLTLSDVISLDYSIPDSLKKAMKRRDEQPLFWDDPSIKPLTNQENEELKSLHCDIDQYTNELPFIYTKKCHAIININTPLDVLVEEFVSLNWIQAAFAAEVKTDSYSASNIGRAIA